MDTRFDSFNILAEQVFDICKIKYSKPQNEAESFEYHACSYKINTESVQHRHAKVTPKKNGQFVTIWKRKPGQTILPFDSSDKVDFFIATVKKNRRYGFFIFPKSILIQKNIFSTNHQGGKRAIRLYPPWDKADSDQSKNTQRWQLDFFIEISKDTPINIDKIKSLLAGRRN